MKIKSNFILLEVLLRKSFSDPSLYKSNVLVNKDWIISIEEYIQVENGPAYFSETKSLVYVRTADKNFCYQTTQGIYALQALLNEVD